MSDECGLSPVWTSTRMVYLLYELAYPQLVSFHECPSTIMILGLGYLIDVFIHIERNVWNWCN